MLFRTNPGWPLFGLLCLVLLSAGTPELLGQGQVAASPEQICPMKIGSRVPALVFTKPDGSSFNLAAAIPEKPTVMIFYRGGW